MINTIKSSLPPKIFFLCFFAIGYITIPYTAQAAVPDPLLYGASGWWMTHSEYMGTSTACGASATVGQVELVEYTNNTPISSIPAWGVQVYDKTNSLVYSWTATSSTSISPKFCYQMSSDYVRTWSDQNDTYYENSGVSSSVKPETPATYYTHFYKARLHLKRRSVGFPAISPIFPHFSVVNYDPSYIANTIDISSLYSATGLYLTKYYAVNADTFISSSNAVSSVGGAGQRTLPPLSLADGTYYWYFFQGLNGDVTFSNGSHIFGGPPVTPITEPTPFMVDKTPPVTSVAYTENSTTSTSMNVTITNTYKDVTSGAYKTTVFVNEVTPSITSASGEYALPDTTDELTIGVDVVLDLGATYNYYAVSIDQAGNIATSTVQTIVTPSYIAAAAPGDPTANILLPAAASSYTYDAANKISFSGEAFDSDSNSIPSGNANWEWRLNDCNTGTDIGGNQASFDYSTIGSIPPDGTAHNVYLKVQEKSTGLWSNNCPSRQITINCPVGYNFVSPGCEPIVVTYPDLTSKNLSLSSGPYVKDSSINLSADVENLGLASTGSPFYDRFSYSWDSITWTAIAPDILRPDLAPTTSYSDVIIFTPTQSGTLYIRHCVNVTDIDEGLNVAPNCSTIGPKTVTTPASATLFGSGCTTIPVGGGDSCSGKLTWTISDALSPNLYNSTESTSISTAVSGTDLPISLKWGPNTIQARDNTSVLNSITLTAACNNTSFWTGTSCEPSPTITLVAGSELIRSGATTNVSMTIDSDIDLNCTLYAITDTPHNFTHTASASPTIYPAITTKPLKFAQTALLKCSPVIAPSTYFEQKIKINVVPTFTEV
ncbi:MAG: hypothetical protein RLZZ230_678 [Candidatus Parcubacteria bacterium]|jgi:hypothetical protein